MTHRGLASLGFAVWAAALALSTSASHAQSYKQCQAEANGIIPMLKDCDAAELDRREAVLNRLYKQVLVAVSPGRQTGLRKAERAWVAFADAECDFRMSAEAGGMDAPLAYNACRLELIAHRIDDLQRALKVAQFPGGTARLAHPLLPNPQAVENADRSYAAPTGEQSSTKHPFRSRT